MFLVRTDSDRAALLDTEAIPKEGRPLGHHARMQMMLEDILAAGKAALCPAAVAAATVAHGNVTLPCLAIELPQE